MLDIFHYLSNDYKALIISSQIAKYYKISGGITLKKLKNGIILYILMVFLWLIKIASGLLLAL